MESFMTDTSLLGQAHLRVARPTDRMPEMIRFYRDGLGFEVLSSFEDHDGFDGVILGHPSAAYHLEFTHHRGDQAGKAPGKDNLLVFYLPDRRRWEKAIAGMRAQGYEPVWSANPFWNVRGRTFEDADGYRIVLQQAAWP
jgi:catechol 2,3-dioxygenase-like lactoylglutathione lyase family enzyme